MHFDTHQQEILDTTLESLVCYVNGRFKIVREISTACAGDKEAQSQLVERYIWNHSNLIDDFVRDNPDHLSETHLSIAAGLTSTLYGSIILESIRGNIVTFLHHTGTYEVVAPENSILSHLPGVPLELTGAIAPYEDFIVPLPPFTVLGKASAGQISKIHADLAAQGTNQPTGDAKVLRRRARLWKEHHMPVRRHAVDKGNAPGFHRGALAGLTSNERAQARAAHYDRETQNTQVFKRTMEARCIDVDELPVTLKEALALLEDDWLNDIALEIDGYTTKMDGSREDLINLICRFYTAAEEQPEFMLVWSHDLEFELIERLTHTNPLPLDQLAPSIATELFPYVPYVFFLNENGVTYAWMPPELRTLLTKKVIADLREMRDHFDTMRLLAAGMATMCGIVRLSDVYERYRRLVDQPFEPKFFEPLLAEMETCDSRDSYALWRHLGRDYVISTEISDASAPARVTREHFSDRVITFGDEPSQGSMPTIVGLSEQDERKFTRHLARKEAELERKRLSLLAQKGPMEVHDILPGMLERRPIEALLELDALQALRAFVDNHVPDNEDDYEFPDLFARSVVISSVLMQESYNDTMDLIRLYHMQECEGTDFSDTLGQLVTNAFNALPRWTLNGWSLEENTERITGRRRFYDQDGKPLVLEDSDPCPCGSGKPYGSCCGNLKG